LKERAAGYDPETSSPPRSVLRFGVALQTQPGSLRCGRELQIDDGDVLRLHCRLRMACGAVHLRAIREARVAAAAPDRPRYKDGSTTERVHVSLGNREERVVETGRPTSRMAGEAGCRIWSKPGNARMTGGYEIQLFAVTGRAVLLREILPEGLVRPHHRVAGEAAGEGMARRWHQREPFAVIADASHLRVGVAPQAKRGRVRGHFCPGEAADLNMLGRRVRLRVTRSAVDQLPVERIDMAGGASDPRVFRAHCDRESRMIERRRSASRVAAEAGCGVSSETRNAGVAAGDAI